MPCEKSVVHWFNVKNVQKNGNSAMILKTVLENIDEKEDEDGKRHYDNIALEL
eukprot:Pgem_evm1s4539